MPISGSAEKPPLALAYLDTSGTSALTGISESTLEKQRLSGGGIPFIKAGRLVKYAVADIHAWMAARRRSSTSDTSEIPPPSALGSARAAPFSAFVEGATGEPVFHNASAGK